MGLPRRLAAVLDPALGTSISCWQWRGELDRNVNDSDSRIDQVSSCDPESLYTPLASQAMSNMQATGR
eukprot:scaffold122211_cov21-Prasinocladus_malaysianus.AAC.1